MRIAIVTRNAIHGGVETLIALHQRRFHADVFVVGGYDVAETCPFHYSYISGGSEEKAREQLGTTLAAYDLVMYHWIPAWALEAIRAANKPSIEVIHRIDTADGDKTVPTLLVAHSVFLAEFVRRQSGRDVLVIPHGVEVERLPEVTDGRYVGALTSYYQTKGIDLFLVAWSLIQGQFPDERVRFYGSGDDLPRYQRMIAELGLRNVELLGPVKSPEQHFQEFRLFVQPSRVEGLPVAVLEALACNIPVVCSDLPGLVEFNRSAQQRGFAPPLILSRAEDSHDLARVLDGVLRQRGLTRETRDYIRQYYNAELHCQAYGIAFGRALERFETRHPLPAVAPPGGNGSSRGEWSQLEIEQLRWLARLAYRLRGSRWYPLFRRLGKPLIRTR